MNKSQLFTLAHKKTRKAQVIAQLSGSSFDYRLTFGFYLKQLNKKQLPQTRQRLQVNKACAMVGDYKKPTAKSDNVELPYFIVSVVAILIIFIATLQAINYF